jgi:methylenetetrahydrofolate reductase (NADPH)
MSKQGPKFMDVTWGAGGSTSATTLAIATSGQKILGVPINMHLTCTNMPADLITQALSECSKSGVTNICALRGDPPHGESEWKAIDTGYSCALDLVKSIRKDGNDLCLTVAGYSEGHPNAIKPVADISALSDSELSRVVTTDEGQMVCHDDAFEKEIAYLKQKVDAGANAIISQLFYDVELFITFIRKCRSVGIEVPIIPGIMPIANKRSFTRMTGFCKTRIPKELTDQLSNATTDEEVQAVGDTWVINMCKRLLDSKLIRCLHFYTMNKEEHTYRIMKGLGIKIVDTSAEVFAAEAAAVATKIKTALAGLELPPKPQPAS